MDDDESKKREDNSIYGTDHALKMDVDKQRA